MRRRLAALTLLAAISPVSCGLTSAERVIRPVTHTGSGDRERAMRSASRIVVAEILQSRIVGGPRNLVRLGNTASSPADVEISLYLAKLSIKPLLTLRGEHEGVKEIYGWIWNSGKHGGSRLFQPTPGTVHIFFLTTTAGFVHPVGDYPGYDIPIRPVYLEPVLTNLRASSDDPELFQRIVGAMLHSELDAATTFSPNYSPGLESASLSTPFYVANLLADYCLHGRNPAGRLAACKTVAIEFPGRCEYFRVAIGIMPRPEGSDYLRSEHARCVATESDTIAFYQKADWPHPWRSAAWEQEGERRRSTIRLYASAPDSKFHAAACEAALSATTTRDIPECQDRPALGR